MNIPNPVPTGPHTAYVLHDETEPRFKFGVSANLRRRLGDIRRQFYGHQITEYWSWDCKSFFTAFCMEQAAISVVRRFGFEPVLPQDWFAIDTQTLRSLLYLLEDLGRSIKTWENENYAMEYNFFDSRYQTSDYGKYLRANRVSESELKDAMLDHANLDFIDNYINEIKRQRNLSRR